MKFVETGPYTAMLQRFAVRVEGGSARKLQVRSSRDLGLGQVEVEVLWGALGDGVLRLKPELAISSGHLFHSFPKQTRLPFFRPF